MATLNTSFPTLLDLAKRQDPDNKQIAMIIELLNQTNEILDDMVWIEGNLPTGHRTTVRTGLPVATWRKLYQGVKPDKSTTAQITDTTGMLEAYAEVDKALADLNSNAAAFRLSEDKAHIEGMSQTMAQTLIYGNEGIDEAKFTGLAPRFNDKSAKNGRQIIDAAGTGSTNASIWLVAWGDQTCHGIVPRGSTAGLQVNDKGQVTIEQAPDGSGGRMEAYRTHYRWDAGLTVRDWRFIVRIANIDRTALTADAASGAKLYDLMFEATERLHNETTGRPVFYCDREVRTIIRQQIPKATSGSTLTQRDVGGRKIMEFLGIPIKRVDALAVNEAQVT